MGKFIRLASLEFSKLCLMSEAKIITLFDVIFTIGKENI